MARTGDCVNPAILELLTELEETPAPTLDWTNTRLRVIDLHRNAETFDERGLVLRIYVTLMNSVEALKLVADIDAFKEARRKDYNALLISESTNGEDVIPSKLLAVLRREIAAGHTDESHELYDLAKLGDYLQTPPQPPVRTSWWKALLSR